jgi:Xaa-Pro dipeptidase
VTFADTYPGHLEYLQRGTEAALAAHGFDAVVLCSGTAAQKSRFDDQYWPLCPTPSFAHWCPLVEADAYVVVRPGYKPRLVRTVVEDFWETQAPPESDHFWDAFDVIEVKPGLAGDALPGGKVAIITRDQGTSPPGTVNPPALIAALDLLRTRKTAYEIECLAIASRRAAKGHKRLADLFGSGTPSELELHLSYLQATEQDDTSAPYKNIIALGEHAAVLHYVSYQKQSVTGDTSLLVDAARSARRQRHHAHARPWHPARGEAVRQLLGVGRCSKRSSAVSSRACRTRTSTTRRTSCSRSRSASSASVAAARTSSSTRASRARCSRTGWDTRSASRCTTSV